MKNGQEVAVCNHRKSRHQPYPCTGNGPEGGSAGRRVTGSVSVRSLHPRRRQEGEGAAHPGGAAAHGQRQSGVICGHCPEEHGPGRAQQGAHWYVQTSLHLAWERVHHCWDSTPEVSVSRQPAASPEKYCHLSLLPATFHGWISQTRQKTLNAKWDGSTALLPWSSVLTCLGVQVSHVFPGDGKLCCHDSNAF